MHATEEILLYNMVMKNKHLLSLFLLSFLLVGCANSETTNSQNASDTVSNTQTQSVTQTGGDSQTGGRSQGGESQQTPVKTTVSAHTLSDSKPSGLNLNSKGEKVSEDKWNSFKYFSTSKYSGYYNYTYTSITGYTNRTIEKFTKNGYYAETNYGKIYYEKSNSKCYSYANVSDGLQRMEQYFDIAGKCKTTLEQEIYVHMFDFENYEYDDYDGCYWYRTTSFGAAVKFQNGYLTYLHYSQGAAGTFDIEAVFDTTINIPESYYLK